MCGHYRSGRVALCSSGRADSRDAHLSRLQRRSTSPGPSFPWNPMSRIESSKQRYRAFVKAYKDHTLEDPALTEHKPLTDPKRPGRRKEYLRDYANWLWPHRFAISGFFLLALITAGLEMVEP